MAEDDSVLRRWHRRKTAARRGDPVEPGFEAEDDTASLVAVEGESGTEVGEDEASIPDLPDVETLTEDSDFSVFLKEGVPEELQRLALRKLWRLDPVFANLDGLVDYGNDFTNASMVVEGMRTAYRVGKGMLSDEEHAAMTDTETEAVSSDSEDDDAQAVEPVAAESSGIETSAESASAEDVASTLDAESTVDAADKSECG